MAISVATRIPWRYLQARRRPSGGFSSTKAKRASSTVQSVSCIIFAISASDVGRPFDALPDDTSLCILARYSAISSLTAVLRVPALCGNMCLIAADRFRLRIPGASDPINFKFELEHWQTGRLNFEIITPQFGGLWVLKGIVGT